MDEATIKRSFRTAYDFVISHQHPQHTSEYFTSVLDDFKKIRSSGKSNILLECLLVGVYEYLEREAKEEAIE